MASVVEEMLPHPMISISMCQTTTHHGFPPPKLDENGTGLIEIAALTTLVGSATSASLVMDDKEAPGLA